MTTILTVKEKNTKCQGIISKIFIAKIFSKT